MESNSALTSPWSMAAIVANVFLNQIGIPIPAEPVLVIAGAAYAARPVVEIGLILSAGAACVAADVVWFVAGRRLGGRVLGTLCRLSLTPDICVGETQVRFERWGASALLFAKFVPGLALLAPPLAGAVRLSWARFLAYTAVGSVLWVGAFVLGGAIFERQIEAVYPILLAHRSAAVAAVVGLVAAYVALKWWERQRLYARMRAARVTVDSLRSLIESGEMPVIVDVRSHLARQLAPRQIVGAMHLVPGELDRHVPSIPRDRDVVLYCACPNEASAAQVADLLIKRGLRRVRPLLGGLDAWVAAGHPVEPVPNGAAST